MKHAHIHIKDITMSHEFESGMFAGEPAWHRLGKVLDNPPTTEQAIIEAGLETMRSREAVLPVDAAQWS